MSASKQYISTSFFIALVLMAMSIPLSLYMMSVMQFALTIFWAYEGFDAKSKKVSYWVKYPFANGFKKLISLRKNKLALILISYYCIHLLGLFFTQNQHGALEVLRLNVPIIVFTVIISTSKALSRNQLNALLLFFVGAVISASFWGLYIFSKQEFSDIRELSQFMHPIKFSLSICLGIFILIHFLYIRLFSDLFSKLILILGTLWLIYYLSLMESGSGLLTVAILTYLTIIFLALKLKTTYKIVFSFFLLAIPVFGFYLLKTTINQFNTSPEIEFSSLEKHTINGGTYTHDTINYKLEDGKFIGLYICEDELKEAWNLRSELPYDGKDLNGQELKRTLIRFLNSLDYRKDIDGVSKLSDNHIRAIERGIANIHYLRSPGIKTRIHKFLMGYELYKQNKDPNGNSVIQRMEYIKASFELIRKNFWLGVGTGDITPVFKKYYKKTNSKLLQKNRLLSHNQYLHSFITYGIWGLLWFLFVLIYPFRYKINTQNLNYLFFIGILILSMFSSDVLSGSAGIIFYAFFNALFLFGTKPYNNY